MKDLENDTPPHQDKKANSGNWRIILIMLCSLLGIGSVLFLLVRSCQ
jgi:hypothetical protein